MFKKKSKKIEPICKNCRLFNPETSECEVVILHEGERYNLPVNPEDKCFFETEITYINEKGEMESFKPEVQQTRFWVENPDENGNGTLKIEYPEDFFGE